MGIVWKDKARICEICEKRVEIDYEEFQSLAIRELCNECLDKYDKYYEKLEKREIEEMEEDDE